MLKQAFNFVSLIASTSGGALQYHLAGGTTASTNAMLVSAGAHTLLGGNVINTTTTIGYLRFYDLATQPVASSATGSGWSVPVPASISGAPGAGVILTPGTFGIAFLLGLGFVVTGGGGDTDNSNAPAGIFVNLCYK